MKTFKPGILAFVILTSLLLCVVSVATKKIWPQTITGDPEAKQVESETDNEPWRTSGVWSFFDSDKSKIACLYSQEQIAINKSKGKPNEETEGLLCIAERDGEFLYTIDVPGNYTYKWDGELMLSVAFTMPDGSQQDVNYFAMPMKNSKSMMKIEPGYSLNRFGFMVTHAARMDISAVTSSGKYKASFRNGSPIGRNN